MYFGRSITLETIEEYQGRELTDEELEEQNPFARDFLFCPSCETYFSLLEDYYSKEVYQKLLAGNFGNVSQSGSVEVATFGKVSCMLVLLFIYSIFFRCSVARYHGFHMNYFERKFRKILLKYKEKELSTIERNLFDGKDDFTFFSFINTFSVAPNDTTKNFVTILHSKRPYFSTLIRLHFISTQSVLTSEKQRSFFMELQTL